MSHNCILFKNFGCWQDRTWQQKLGKIGKFIDISGYNFLLGDKETFALVATNSVIIIPKIWNQMQVSTDQNFHITSHSVLRASWNDCSLFILAYFVQLVISDRSGLGARRSILRHNVPKTLKCFSCDKMIPLFCMNCSPLRTFLKYANSFMAGKRRFSCSPSLLFAIEDLRF